MRFAALWKPPERKASTEREKCGGWACAMRKKKPTKRKAATFARMNAIFAVDSRRRSTPAIAANPMTSVARSLASVTPKRIAVNPSAEDMNAAKPTLKPSANGGAAHGETRSVEWRER